MPEIAVETGTFRGETTEELLKCFGTVHTIELSKKWYESARRRFEDQRQVLCHHGDSGKVVALLVNEIAQPVFFFLDAHFAGGDTAFGAEEVPLLREIESIRNRPYQDIVVIDDLRLLGKTGRAGTPGSDVYPPMVFDWREITLDRLQTLLPVGEENAWMFTNDRILILRNIGTLPRRILSAIAAVYTGKNVLVDAIQRGRSLVKSQ
jgi:hypothetical protein